MFLLMSMIQPLPLIMSVGIKFRVDKVHTRSAWPVWRIFARISLDLCRLKKSLNSWSSLKNLKTAYHTSGLAVPLEKVYPKRAAIDPVDPFAAEGDGGIMGNPDMISLDCLNQIIRGKDAQIERLKTISDNVVALMKEMKETNAKIDRLQSRFDTVDASLKTLIDLLLPGT